MSRVIAPFAQFFDGEGDPLSNGFLRFLETSTNNTLKNTYADSSQTIPNANPLQLDAEGRCPNAFGSGIYRVDLYTYNPVTGLPGELVQSFDPVLSEYTALGAGGNFAAWNSDTIYDISDIVIYNGKYYRSIRATNQGKDPLARPDYWEEISFLRYWNTNVVYLVDDVVIYNGGLYFSLAGANQGNIPLSSPTWWSPVGSGTVLLHWQESGTTLQPAIAGYDLGSGTNYVGTAYINDFGTFPLTPLTDPVNDYDVSNKQYVDWMSADRMRWIGDWVPGTYEEFDVVRDDQWTMIANAQTDDRPAPQPVGDAEWVRDSFSPPAFSEATSSESVLYIGQRYTFTPSFLVEHSRIYLPAAAVGFNVEFWAVINPTGSFRILNLYPGTIIEDTMVDKWISVPVDQIYVEDGTIIDFILVIRSPAAENTFTFEWDYVRVNGDPLPGEMYHQSGGNVDQIRVHEQDTSLVDRTSFLDNIGPGSVIYMAASDYTWEVLSASKTGDVYTFIVDPGARAATQTSDFTFTYFTASLLPYVYNTDLYISDSRIKGYFGNIYDPTNATYINDNGYGLDIQVQTVIVSPYWDIVSQPSVGIAGDGGSVFGYWEESDEYLRPITDNTGYLGDTSHQIQGIYLSDGAAITSSGSLDIIAPSGVTINGGPFYSADNGPMAGFRNKLINPFFEIWQRYLGSAYTVTGFTADRTYITIAGGATGSVDRVAGISIDDQIVTQYGMGFVFTDDATADCVASYRQRIEDVRTIYGDCSVRITANIPVGNEVGIGIVQVHGSGGSADAILKVAQTMTGTGTTTTYEIPITIPAPGTVGTGSYIEFTVYLTAGSDFTAYTDLGNQTSGTVTFYAQQLEPGIYSTPYEQRFMSIERVLCDRYAYVVDSSYSSTNVSYFAPGVVISATQCANIVTTAAPLYKAPVATLLSGNYRLRTSIVASPTDITIYGWDGGNYIYVIPGGVSGLTPGECGLLGVDSAGKILLDSEI